MVFKSVKDWFFPIVWIFILVIFGFIAFFSSYSSKDSNVVLELGLVSLGLGGFFLLIHKTTYYRFEEDHLFCTSLFIRKRIPYLDIKKLRFQMACMLGGR